MGLDVPTLKRKIEQKCMPVTLCRHTLPTAVFGVQHSRSTKLFQSQDSQHLIQTSEFAMILQMDKNSFNKLPFSPSQMYDTLKKRA